MGLVVEVGVNGGVIEAEVGTEVHQFEATIEEIFGERGGGSVGEGEEGDLGSGGGDSIHIGFDEANFRAGVSFESWENFGYFLPGIRTRGDGDDLGFGMAKDEAEEFQTGVSAGSDDRDFGDSRHLRKVVLCSGGMGKRESQGVRGEWL